MHGETCVEFKEKIFISGEIISLTGLHIGGNSTEMSIGGADHVVVRDPITNYPYLPGSSLRGKLRSLYERTHGEMTVKLKKDRDGKTVKFKDLGKWLADKWGFDAAGPSTDPESMSSKLFGVAIDKQNNDDLDKMILQRLLVRDAKLSNPEELEKAKNTDMPLTEVKTEVAIDRITSKANPRQIERVPAGARFCFEFIVNLYGTDDRKNYLNTLFQCMELLQDDYLGGHGSRGYGRIAFDVKKIENKTAEDYRNNKTRQEETEIEIPPSLKFSNEQPTA